MKHENKPTNYNSTVLTSLGHTNTTVNNSQRVIGLIRNDVNEKFGLAIELALVSQTFKSDLVQGLYIIKHQ